LKKQTTPNKHDKILRNNAKISHNDITDQIIKGLAENRASQNLLVDDNLPYCNGLLGAAIISNTPIQCGAPYLALLSYKLVSGPPAIKL
jgi:hypothetical protein